MEELLKKRNPELVRLYAPRSPMTQLPDRYRVTKKNPRPPTLHFAFPHLNKALYKYAEECDLIKHYGCPIMSTSATLFSVADHLSEHVEYDLRMAFPFLMTADCTSILVLYDNYTMKGKKLIKEDEEDVIQMVQEALGYDDSIRPKWYFDVDDPWQPGDDDDKHTN